MHVTRSVAELSDVGLVERWSWSFLLFSVNSDGAVYALLRRMFRERRNEFLTL